MVIGGVGVAAAAVVVVVVVAVAAAVVVVVGGGGGAAGVAIILLVLLLLWSLLLWLLLLLLLLLLLPMSLSLSTPVPLSSSGRIRERCMGLASSFHQMVEMCHSVRECNNRFGLRCRDKTRAIISDRVALELLTLSLTPTALGKISEGTRHVEYQPICRSSGQVVRHYWWSAFLMKHPGANRNKHFVVHACAPRISPARQGLA